MTSQVKPEKRPAPLSLRLTTVERKTLERLAGKQSLSGFIKDRVFIEAPAVRSAKVVDQYQLLVHLLAALGESDVFGNLDKIAEAVELGELNLSDAQHEEIAVACLLVLEMRDNLIRALGLKPPTLPNNARAK